MQLTSSGGPLQSAHLLASAPLSWSLLAEYESSVVVAVTTRHERDNGVYAGATYLLTSEVEILRDAWEVHSVTGPELLADDADELCDDVARAFESRVGVRYRDIVVLATDTKAVA